MEEVVSTALRADWETLLCAIRQAAEDVVFADTGIDTDVVRAEGLRYVTRLLISGTLTLSEVNDPAYPHFARFLSPWFPWGGANPDYDYLWAPVDPQYTYWISGNRGTAHLFSIEVGLGDRHEVGLVRLVNNRSDFASGQTEFAARLEREFSVVLSAEERPGNWIPLPPDASWVHVRQGFYDWETEVPADVFIEREGAVYPPPALTLEFLTHRLQVLTQFVETAPRGLAKEVARQYATDPGIVPFALLEFDGNDKWGYPGQYYGRGCFECGPDEAVILEVRPPERCLYWGFCLSSHFWEYLEAPVRQASINGHQAVLDEDGMLRCVIAHRDPGVPNWLDPGGRTRGLVMGRWNRSDSVPTPTLRVIPFRSVREELPNETPVVTPPERNEMLRRRMLAMQRRKCY